MKSFRAPDVNFRCRFVYSTRPPPVGPVTDRLLAAGLGWAWTWTRTYDIGVHSLRPLDVSSHSSDFTVIAWPFGLTSEFIRKPLGWVRSACLSSPSLLTLTWSIYPSV